MTTPHHDISIMLTSLGLTMPGGHQAEMLAKLDGLLKARKPHGDPMVLYISDAAVGIGFNMEDLYSRFKAELAKIGVFNVIPVELGFVSPLSLTELLEEADCVYVEMGNTFKLRYYMHTSGFDKILPPLVRHSGLIYVGASAGAIVAGRSITSAFWKGSDDPGYGQVWDLSRIGYDGLNLLPGGQTIFPHYSARWTSTVDAKREELGHGLLTISDSQVCLAGNCAGRVPINEEMIITEVAPAVLIANRNSTDVSPPYIPTKIVEPPSNFGLTAVPMAWQPIAGA